MNSGFYHCPDCDGEGSIIVGPNSMDPDAWRDCPRCGGDCIIPEEDLEFLEVARPWTPSKRRWRGGPPGWSRAMQPDPLEQLCRVRNRYGAGGKYIIAKRHAIDSLSDAHMGLIQVDLRVMAAREGTPCAS